MTYLLLGTKKNPHLQMTLLIQEKIFRLQVSLVSRGAWEVSFFEIAARIRKKKRLEQVSTKLSHITLSVPVMCLVCDPSKF